MTNASNTTSRKTGNHLLALYAAINHMVLRAWCATPSSWGRATVRAGASNTFVAASLPVSEVFSRPEFKVLGVGSAYPRGRRQAYGLVTTPHIHPIALVKQGMVFATPVGAKTMTTSPVASRSAAPTTTPDLVQLHLQACNALAQALHTLRNSECTANDLHRAIGRTLRAGTALKRMAGEVAA